MVNKFYDVVINIDLWRDVASSVYEKELIKKFNEIDFYIYSFFILLHGKVSSLIQYELLFPIHSFPYLRIT